MTLQEVPLSFLILVCASQGRAISDSNNFKNISSWGRRKNTLDIHTQIFIIISLVFQNLISPSPFPNLRVILRDSSPSYSHEVGGNVGMGGGVVMRQNGAKDPRNTTSNNISKS